MITWLNTVSDLVKDVVHLIQHLINDTVKLKMWTNALIYEADGNKYFAFLFYFYFHFYFYFYFTK